MILNLLNKEQYFLILISKTPDLNQLINKEPPAKSINWWLDIDLNLQ